MGRFAHILTLFAVGISLGWGQTYRFREYRQEHGLGNLVVTSVVQTRDRFLWIGTQNGLYRFDGVSFQPYGREDGLPAASIVGLAEGGDGSLWVNTSVGLAKATPGGRFEAQRVFLESTGELGLGLAVAPNGDVYMGTSRGIFRGQRVGARHSYAYSGLPIPGGGRRPVAQIAVDARSRAWFGCGGVLCRALPTGEVEELGVLAGLPADQYEGVAIDPEGSLLVRSRTRVFCWRDRMERFEEMPAPLATTPGETASLFAGRAGEFFAPSRAGLSIWQNGEKRWRTVGAAQGLPGDTVSAVLRDHEDSLWIGFAGNGAARWLGYEEWEGYTTKEGLNSNSVWSILRDRRGVLWAAGDAGVNWFDEEARRWRSLDGPAGPDCGRIHNLMLTPDGRLLAMSIARGLLEIDPVRRRARLLGKPAAWPIERFYYVFLDSQRRLWFGTDDGLFRASLERPLQWERMPAGEPSERESIFSLSEDRRGRIWAAGSHGILTSLGRGEGPWKRWTTADGLKSNSTWYAREIKEDQVWIGYLESLPGSRLDLRHAKGALPAAPKWMHLRETESPASFNQLFNGLDQAANHWVGTDRGVYVYSADGKSVTRFSDLDGLIWNDCNSNAFFADNLDQGDGAVWIGTSRGLSRVRLRRPLGVPDPELRLVSINVNGRSAEAVLESPGKPLAVPGMPNDLEIYVSPLTFRYESRLQYQFRIRNQGNNWTTSRANSISFSQLRPGDDEIEARVKVDRFPWSPRPLRVPVRVHASFWWSWWGRGLIGLAIAALVAALWRSRTRALHAEKQRLAEAVEKRTAEIAELLAEARQANRLKSEFLANMSHEIRTPMNGVLGMLQLVEGTRLDGEQQEYLDLAKGSAKSLLSLLNEILDLSKVESGKMELESHAFSIDAVVRQVTGLLEGNARQKGLEIRTEIAENVRGAVVGDRRRLEQVLLNLVGNAVKFTESGHVALRVQLVPAAKSARPTQDPGPSAGWYRFEVADTGIGIPDGKLAVIFEAFRQADGSTTRRYGGTGLGLAISRRLVELMGGRIEVASERGLGSSFVFTVPLRTEEWAGTEAAPVESAQTAAKRVAAGVAKGVAGTGKRLRILLAEDNRVNRLVAARMLESAGHEVRHAADGALAVEAMRAENFDLVLMDVHMPVMDGLRATAEIRALERQQSDGRRRTIYALTAGVLDEERERCRQAGMDGFLAKPLAREELLAVLARCSYSGAPGNTTAEFDATLN